MPISVFSDVIHSESFISTLWFHDSIFIGVESAIFYGSRYRIVEEFSHDQYLLVYLYLGVSPWLSGL